MPPCLPYLPCRSTLAIALAVAFITACGITPNKPPLVTEAPRPVNPLANTIEYRCAGGNKLNLRVAEGGGYASVFVMNREYRLYKITSVSSSRYSNGAGATLDLRGNDATFSAGGGVAYTECKLAGV